jgi:ubiquinone/menaquinone biosynthesis C-methylase UbiE
MEVDMSLSRETPKPRVCPWWIGHLLASPIRRLVHDPRAIVGPHVREGMTLLDVGCAMGYFSLPMARMVGAAGRVVCVDVQERMLHTLRRRAEREGLSPRLDLRLAGSQGMGLADLDGVVGFALAFAVMHEIPDRARALGEIASALVADGRLLIAEPRHHVSAADFETTLSLARERGLEVVERLPGRSALLGKQG